MRNRENLVDCASRFARLMAIENSPSSSSSNVSSDRLHDFIADNIVEKYFPPRNGPQDHINDSLASTAQLRLLILARTLSATERGKPFRARGAHELSTYLHKIVSKSMQTKGESSISFLRALILHFPRIDHSMSILLNMLSGELSMQENNREIIESIYFVLSQSLAPSINKVGRQEAVQAAQAVQDSMLSAVNSKIVEESSILHESIFGYFRRIPEMTYRFSGDIESLEAKIAALAQKIMNTDGISLRSKVVAFCSISRNNLEEADRVVLREIGLWLLVESMRKRSIIYQLALLRAFTPSDFKGCKQLMELVCQCTFDCFYYGVFSDNITFEIGNEETKNSEVLLSQYCYDMLLGTDSDDQDGTKDLILFRFIESITRFLIRRQEDDRSSSELQSRLLRLLGFISGTKLPDPVADLVYAVYLNLLDATDTDILVRKTCTENLCRFVLKNERFLDTSVEHVFATFKGLIATALDLDDIFYEDSISSTLRFFISFSTLPCQSTRFYFSLQRSLIHLVKFVQTYYCSSCDVSRSRAFIVCTSISEILEALAELWRSKRGIDLNGDFDLKDKSPMFRDFFDLWSTLLFVKLYFHETFPDAWKCLEPICRKAASMGSPLIFSKGSTGAQLLDFELSKIIVVDRTNIKKCGGESAIRKFCQTIVCEKLSAVPLHYAVFLAMLSFMETLRISENLDACHLMSYLSDSTLSSDPLMNKFLPCIIDQLLSDWLSIAKVKLDGGSSNSPFRVLVVDVFVSYIFSLVDENAFVQNLSMKFMENLITTFPWLSWEVSALYSVLDSLHALTILKYPELSSTENSFYQDYFPLDLMCSSSALKNVFDVAYLLLSVGLRYFPDVVRIAVAEYVLIPRVSLSKNHVGLAVIREMLASGNPTFYLSLLQGTYSVVISERACSSKDIAVLITKIGFKKTEKHNLETFDDEISSKIRMVGEANNFLADATRSDKLLLTKMSEMQLRVSIVDGSINVTDAIKAMRINSAIVREVLLLTDIKSTDKRSVLIDFIFTLFFVSEQFPEKEVFDTVLDSCHWVSFCYPNSEIFNQFYALILEVSVQNKLGLFSSSLFSVESPEDVDVLATTRFVGRPHSFCNDPIYQFPLLEHFCCDVNLQNTSSFEAIASSLCSAFYGLSCLRGEKVNRRSILPRFKLLYLGLKLLSCSISSSCNISVDRRCKLRECVYSSALIWFETQVTWAEPCTSPYYAMKVADSIYEFLELLEEDRDFWLLDYSFDIDTIWQSIFENVSWLRSLHHKKIISKPAVEFSFLHDTFDIIKLLACTELDRIIAWHASKSQYVREVKPIDKITFFVKSKLRSLYRGDTDGSIIFTCWMFSPLLSVRLPDRAPGLCKNLTTLSELIGRNPSADRGWETASILVNYHRFSGDNQAAERAVNELMYFDVAPAFIAIDMLNRCNAEGRERMKGAQKIFRSSNTAPSIVRYVVRSVEMLPKETVQFFLPQFVQLLRRDTFGLMFDFIESVARKSALICHNLIWLLQTEAVCDVDKTKKALNSYPRHGYCRQLIGSDPLPFKSSEMLASLRSSLSSDALGYLNVECSFFDAVTNISAKLKSVKDKETHNQIIKAELLKLGMPSGLYMPTDPKRLVVGVDIDSGIPMQSAAKCPFLLVFFTESWEGPDGSLPKGTVNTHFDHSLNNHESQSLVNSSECMEKKHEPDITVTSSLGKDHALVTGPRKSIHHIDRGLVRWRLGKTEDREDSNKGGQSQDACIFKVYDDCRQDAIVMQVVEIFHRVFRDLNLPLTLIPYSIIPNRTGPDAAIGGILQVVANVKSRDQLGKAGSKTLLQYFASCFGHPGSHGFQRAQLAFTSSLAAYAIICYLMSIKDRHNGNVLVDRLGNICHIDYGFILGISPGGNIGFESAAFKLSAEMLELMGGVDSPIFLQFADTVTRGFLVARRLQAPLLSTISAFADSGLPCFMHKDDNLASLRDKFLPDKRDSEASEHMKKLIFDAANKWTTKAYDGIQKLQNNIYSEYWK